MILLIQLCCDIYLFPLSLCIEVVKFQLRIRDCSIIIKIDRRSLAILILNTHIHQIATKEKHKLNVHFFLFLKPTPTHDCPVDNPKNQLPAKDAKYHEGISF